MKVGGVLLASGAGRRFGGNKLLAPVEGVPLCRRAMAALAGAGLDRLALCSPYPEVLELGAALGFAPMFNPNAAEGVSASIRLGLSAMDGMDGVLFSVCDQPWLTTESIIRLKNAFLESETAVCALAWKGKRGNPAIFPADLFGELAALTGDAGGSAVLRAHPDRLRLVEAASPRELLDVDTPEDLTR